jgi:hypothetical protein
MGFDAWFFARLDYADKERRMNEKELEFIWMPNEQSLGSDVNIFTHVLYRHYSSPDGFGFDTDSNDQQWINDITSEDFNAPAEAEYLKSQLDERIDHYLTDDMFVLIGDDFRYVNAYQNYMNIDNMIEYMNANYNDTYHFKYATPSNYVDAVAKHNVSWPTKYDDMFPYSDNPDGYWTGYFSSRANDKELIRKTSHQMHASTQLYSEKALDISLQSE